MNNLAEQATAIFNNLNRAFENPVDWTERTFTLKGQPVEIRDTGRNYLYEPYNYMCFEMPIRGIPVLFVKGRQIECTTSLEFVVSYTMRRIAHNTYMWTFPMADQGSRFCKMYWDPLIENTQDGALDGWKAANDPDSVKMKVYKNGSILHILGAHAKGGEGKEGDSVRNISVDGVIKDEYQDMDPMAEGVVDAAASHSNRYFRVSLGTPKEEHTIFHQSWLDSDQREYHLRCESCKGYFLLGWDNFIREFLAKCTECGHLQDKRYAVERGKWIAMAPQNKKVRGYHISQTLAPWLTKEKIQADVDRAERMQGKDPQRYLKNECLGEFYSGIGLRIDAVDIKPAFIPDLPIMNMLPPGVGSFAGIDWGGHNTEGREGRSYNCIGFGVLEGVKQGVEAPRIRLVYAEVLEDPDILKNVERILELCQQFNTKLIVADKGWGKIQVNEMRKLYGNKVIACHYTDSIQNWYRFTLGVGNTDPTMVVDRDTSLEELFLFMKSGKLVVPKVPEYGWIYEHMFGHKIEEQTLAGRMRKKFVKITNKLTDGCHMLNYIKLAASFANRKELGTYLSQPNRSLPAPIGPGGVVNSENKVQPKRMLQRAVPIMARSSMRHRRGQ